MLLVMLHEWWPSPTSSALSELIVLPVMALLGPAVRRGRQMFILLALLLSLAALWRLPDGRAVVARGLASAAFIGAFFCALASLRNAADTSPAIRRAGEYLASRPPGKRYLSLSFGTSLFGPLLNYGAIALLGNLASRSIEGEADPAVSALRTRRMLLAIQRGFIATLAWSPSAYAVVITSQTIPGASWGTALLPGLISGLLLTLCGWWLDRLVRLPPGMTIPAIPSHGEGSGVRSLLPLLYLFLMVMLGSLFLHLISGVRVAGVILVLVPLVSAAWVFGQSKPTQRFSELRWRSRAFLVDELPHYRGELVLLMMAGFIGTVGSQLLLPLMDSAGIDLTNWPRSALLLLPIVLIPLTGQMGMNPILTVSLLGPLLPTPAALGLSPSALMTSITAGWMLSGLSSPFTATTLLTGSFAGVDAREVGIRWNAMMTTFAGGVLALWVLLWAAISG